MNIDKNEFRKYAIKHHRIGSQHVDGYISRLQKIFNI
jgi:ATP-dependent Clp protease protease subunit